jgi:hypothetical protein
VGPWVGCNTINPKEQVPTYIHVDSFHFAPTPSLGNITTSHDINTVWAYYKNDLIGVFDLPTTFPVITNGDNDSGVLTLSPGVPINGFNDNLSAYPFYTLDNWGFKAQPGKVLTHNPTTSFFSTSKIQPVAYFEKNTVETVPLNSISGLVPIVKVTDVSLRFWGEGVGSITLASPADSTIDSTVEAFPIPPNQSNQVLELNYKGDLILLVYIKPYLGGITQGATLLAAAKPSSGWKKLYISLQDYVSALQATGYRFYIKAILPEGQTSGRLFLDNIQIVTF